MMGKGGKLLFLDPNASIIITSVVVLLCECEFQAYYFIKTSSSVFFFLLIFFPTGNIGNVPLVLIAALCRDKDNPFGDSNKCAQDGNAYLAFGQWVDFSQH